jgi:hypothetical protein
MFFLSIIIITECYLFSRNKGNIEGTFFGATPDKIKKNAGMLLKYSIAMRKMQQQLIIT